MTRARNGTSSRPRSADRRSAGYLRECRVMARGARALVFVTAAAWVGGCGDLSRAELKRRVETLDAIAAEGRILATGAAQDRTKTTFTRVHARDLADRAEHEAEKVADARPARGFQREGELTVDLASRISEALGGLETGPGDEAGAREAGDKLVRAGDEAARLEGRL